VSAVSRAAARAVRSGFLLTRDARLIRAAAVTEPLLEQ